jgi:hypothetical protein
MFSRVSIFPDNPTNSFDIFLLYINPSLSASHAKIFLLELSSRLPKHPFIIVGDFNSKHASWSKGNANSMGSCVLSFVDNNNLYILNNIHTPFSATSLRSVATIDLALTNSPSHFPHLQSPCSTISDHLPLVVSTNVCLQRSSSSDGINKCNNNNSNNNNSNNNNNNNNNK